MIRRLLAHMADRLLNRAFPMWSTLRYMTTLSSSAVSPAAADPAGSSPLSAGSLTPPEGVESRGTAIPPSGAAARVYALPTSELLSQSADALMAGAYLADTRQMPREAQRIRDWCNGLRDRAAQFAAHGD